MNPIILNTDDAGTTTRTFNPISELNGNVSFETRDQDRRSLESSMTLSSTHLDSKATKVLSKINHLCTKTENSLLVQSAQNLVKIEIVISDEATAADRLALANMAKSQMIELQQYVEDLNAVYL